MISVSYAYSEGNRAGGNIPPFCNFAISIEVVHKDCSDHEIDDGVQDPAGIDSHLKPKVNSSNCGVIGTEIRHTCVVRSAMIESHEWYVYLIFPTYEHESLPRKTVHTGML